MLTNLSSLWLPIVVSGMALFLASWAAWTLLPHHKSEWKGLPDEEGVMRRCESLRCRPASMHSRTPASPRIGGAKNSKAAWSPVRLARLPFGRASPRWASTWPVLSSSF